MRPLETLLVLANGLALIALGLLVFLVSTALPILISVFRLPRPSGPYAIGTVTYHWVDTARAEMFTADPTDRRELMVQLWYPAVESSASAPRAPYVQDGAALSALAHLFRLPGFVFDHLQYVTTNSVSSARATSSTRTRLRSSTGI